MDFNLSEKPKQLNTLPLTSEEFLEVSFDIQLPWIIQEECDPVSLFSLEAHLYEFGGCILPEFGLLYK